VITVTYQSKGTMPVVASHRPNTWARCAAVVVITIGLLAREARSLHTQDRASPDFTD
jgi:hypothetical protein